MCDFTICLRKKAHSPYVIITTHDSFTHTNNCSTPSKCSYLNSEERTKNKYMIESSKLLINKIHPP